MKANIFPSRISIHPLDSKTYPHTLKFWEESNDAAVHMTIEQIEDLGKECLRYVQEHRDNA
jgi:hypothetical protein